MTLRATPRQGAGMSTVVKPPGAKEEWIVGRTRTFRDPFHPFHGQTLL